MGYQNSEISQKGGGGCIVSWYVFLITVRANSLNKELFLANFDVKNMFLAPTLFQIFSNTFGNDQIPNDLAVSREVRNFIQKYPK